MFLVGLRDRDLIAQVLRTILGYMAGLLIAFLFPPIFFYPLAIVLTHQSASLIVAEVARRYPAISFSQQIRRVYAFPRNSLQRRISYHYALSGTIFLVLALFYIGAHSGSPYRLRDVGGAIFVLALGYPGVVNLILLLHPISHSEEERQT